MYILCTLTLFAIAAHNYGLITMACDLLPPVPEHAFTPLASTLLCRELSEWAVFRAFHSGHCMEYVEQYYNLVEQWSAKKKNGQSIWYNLVIAYFVYPLIK